MEKLVSPILPLVKVIQSAIHGGNHLIPSDPVVGLLSLQAKGNLLIFRVTQSAWVGDIWNPEELGTELTTRGLSGHVPTKYSDFLPWFLCAHPHSILAVRLEPGKYFSGENLDPRKET